MSTHRAMLKESLVFDLDRNLHQGAILSKQRILEHSIVSAQLKYPPSSHWFDVISDTIPEIFTWRSVCAL